jgi:hypothetical protein
MFFQPASYLLLPLPQFFIPYMLYTTLDIHSFSLYPKNMKKAYLVYYWNPDIKRWIFDQALNTSEEAHEKANMFLKRIFTQVRKI